MTQEKTCIKCHTPKPLAEFNQHRGECRGCVRAYMRARYLDNAETFKKAAKAYRQEKPSIPRICLSCGTNFLALPGEVARGGGKYCRHACATAPGRKGTPEERFWAMVDKTPGQGPKGECWIFKGATNEQGYGKFDKTSAHRFAWELERGPIPEGMNVLHECDNPPCVRCLFLGTLADNNEDMRAKGRKWTKLKAEQIPEIRRRLAAGEVQQALADELGVSQGLIGHINNGRAWGHIH